MSQNDFIINNDSFPATRADLTDAFQALASLSSGSTEPDTTYANMLWYDTGTNTLKMLSEGKDQWISVGYLDQSADAFRIFDDTQVVDASGTQTGLIGDQATATWEAGTGTTESLISPAKVKAAVEALAPVGYTDAQARNAQAGHAAGGVGSYALLNFPSEPNASPGSTHAGSSLRYSSANGFDGGTPSGTWRLMGFVTSNSTQGNGNNVSVFLRIA